MKRKVLTVLAAVAIATAGRFAVIAADAPKADLQSEVMPIVAQIQIKLKTGKDTEADLAENLKALDGVIAKHRAEDKMGVGGLYLMKAQIYSQVLDNDAKAAEILGQVKQDYAGTEVAKEADGFLGQIKAGAAAKAVQKALVPGKPFPDFNVKDVTGKPLSIAGYKGKVVLLDFWATWCGPCRAELPNVIETYQKYHAKGFEVVGISLDQSQEKLENYTKAQKMPWPQYFDGLAWGNKLAVKYGVNSIPATYLIDREGKIIAKGLRGEALGEAVVKALGGK